MGKFIVDHSTSNRLVRVWEDVTIGISFEQLEVSKMPILDNTTSQVRLLFDGIDDHMIGSFPIPISTKECTLMYIGKSTLPESGIGVICSFYNNTPEDDLYFVRFGSINATPTVWYGNGTNEFEMIDSTGIEIQSDIDYIWTFRSDGNVREFILNGAIAGTSSVDLVSTINSVQLGANGDNNYTEINPAAIISYNVSKISNKINKINSFISNKYNIDIIPPSISSGSLTTSNILNSGFNVDFTKAIDNLHAQSTLVYELYSGAQQELSSLATIKTQALEDSGTDVSQLTISNANQGALYYYNVLVRDPSGNEAIYTVSSEITLDPEILSFDLSLNGIAADVDNTFEGDAEDQATLSWDINQQDGANDNVTVESLNTDLVIIETLNQTVNGTGSAIIEIQSTGAEDTGTVRVYPSFYGTYNDTPTNFRHEIQVIRQVYESELETQSATYEFEA